MWYKDTFDSVLLEALAAVEDDPASSSTPTDDPFGDVDDEDVLLGYSLDVPHGSVFYRMPTVDPCPAEWSTKSRARWAEFSDEIGWHVTWPVRVTNLFMTEPKYRNRLELMCFGWINGINPDSIIEWFHDAGVLTSDRNKHFESLRHSLETGRYASKWYAYCVDTQRYEHLNGQPVSSLMF